MPLSRLVPPVPSEASFLTDLPSWLSRHTPRFWIGHPELARDHRSQGKSILHHQLSDLQPSTIKPLTAALDWAPSCWRGTTWVDANIGVKRVPPYIYDTFFTAQKIQKPKPFQNIFLENGTSVTHTPLLQHPISNFNLLLTSHSPRHWIGHPVAGAAPHE